MGAIRGPVNLRPGPVRLQPLRMVAAPELVLVSLEAPSAIPAILFHASVPDLYVKPPAHQLLRVKDDLVGVLAYFLRLDLLHDVCRIL